MWVKCPLSYIGGKYKILYQIIPKFPRKIRKFVDLFCGGLNVSINVNASVILVNDANYRVIEIYKYFRATELSVILRQVNNVIKQYDLTLTNRKGYNALRDDYNADQNPLYLFMLTCYSFNHQLDFTKEGKFCSPFGRNRSYYNNNTEKNLINFVLKLQKANIKFKSADFMSIDLLGKYNEQDFVFCDPPYLASDAKYNKDYGEEQEKYLYKMLNKLNKHGVKFALTNAICNKGKENKILAKFASKYRVIELKNSFMTSRFKGKTNEKTTEILVLNY